MPCGLLILFQLKDLFRKKEQKYQYFATSYFLKIFTNYSNLFTFPNNEKKENHEQRKKIKANKQVTNELRLTKEEN